MSVSKSFKSLILLFLLSYVSSENYAYVSILSSDDFTLPARVVAHRLKKFNTTIPYVIIVTESVSDDSIQLLRKEGALIKKEHIINSPDKKKKSQKYQYTKIQYWKMTEYDMLVHLDLDTLPLSDLSVLFKCGVFCASLRHSDKFNAGIFVLKPNETVYNDIKSKVATEYSYDGGDQGFFNSYFDELKFAPMFDHNNLSKVFNNASIRRLSASYNYDIGMYYLNGGRYLVEPIIIHYTMGPIKPWIWWGYPLFDLNWIWLEARNELDDSMDSITKSCIRFALFHSVSVAMLIMIKKVMEHSLADTMVLDRPPSRRERWYVGHFLYLFATLICLKMTPYNAHPIPSWFFFTANTAWMTTIFASIYIKLRSGQDPSMLISAGCLLTCIICHALFWLAVASVSSFQKRVYVCLTTYFIQHMCIVWYIRFMVFNRTLARKPRYQALKVIQAQD